MGRDAVPFLLLKQWRNLLRRLWREDMRLQSVRKNRARSQRRLYSSFRTLRGSNQKHRSSIRSHFFPEGTSALVDQLMNELKGKFLVENSMTAEQNIQSLQEELQARNDDLEELNNTLIIKEHKTNDELVEARKKLLQAFLDMLRGESSVGIKKMGEVDIGPFKKMHEEKLVPEAEVKAAQLCSYWQKRVRDPSWHPFKIVIPDDHSDHKVCSGK